MHFAHVQIDLAAKTYRKLVDNEPEDQSSRDDLESDLYEAFEESDNEDETEGLSFEVTEVFHASRKHCWSDDVYIVEKTEDENSEILLLSSERFNSCFQDNGCSNSCIFRCIILGFYFACSDYKIRHLHCRMEVLLSQIFEAVLEGDRLNTFFSDFVPHSATEAVSLFSVSNLSPSIELKVDVYLEHPEDDCLLEFHLDRLLFLKKRSVVILTNKGESSLFLLDGRAILFVDTHANEVDSIRSGPILIRLKDSLHAFVDRVAKVRGIGTNVKCSLAVIRY